MNGERLDEALKSLAGEGHIATVVDVRKPEQVNAWIEKSVQTFGHINGAANVAGIEHEGGRHFADARDEDWELVMGVNCSGVFYSMRAQLRAMMKAGGSIVSDSTPSYILRAPRLIMMVFRSMYRLSQVFWVSQISLATMLANGQSLA